MREANIEEVLRAAYRCFCTHGFAATSVTEIAQEAGLSRPTIYRHVGGKEQAETLLIQRILEHQLALARTAAGAETGIAERVCGVLGTKIDLALRLKADSPRHAEEFLAGTSVRQADAVQEFVGGLGDLLTGILTPTGNPDIPGLVDVLLTYARGLESDLADPATSHARLASAVRLVIGERADPIDQGARP